MAAVRVVVFALVFGWNTNPLAAQEVIELPAEDRLLDADFEEVYRVGAFNGSEWETFGRVRGVAFDPSGNLYVLDSQAARIVVATQQASISNLQRRLKIGFSRAGRLVDMMEAEGLVSSGTAGKAREVLVKPDYFEEVDRQLR